MNWSKSSLKLKDYLRQIFASSEHICDQAGHGDLVSTVRIWVLEILTKKNSFMAGMPLNSFLEELFEKVKL